MLKKFVFALLPLALLMTACSSQVDLAIDNPTDQTVVCHVDSLYVEVPPKEVVWVEMGKGVHSIKLDTDSIVKFDFTQPVYMVNPSLSEYVMYEEMYGTSPLPSSIPKQKVSIMGIEFEGNYQVFNNVINEVKWDYGPREATPEMIEIEQGDRPAVLKLMDQSEMSQLLMQSMMNNMGGEE